nr:HAMP domain-containing sensor histidine kinase [Kibdelosporangium sp. MJ126-NF4]CEL23115.1 sensor histidine kinase [Kibdelosporangium sp. MJ126-NF4]CTQ90252.1 sensor histidine kinase [Kibdelosporangium sp. MJ126-NF4]
MLRARLTAVVLTAAVTAILVTVVVSYYNVSPLVAAQIDRSLADRADTVLALLGADAPLPARPDMTEQLVRSDGSVQPLTPGMTPLPVSDSDRAIARTGEGVEEVTIVVNGLSYGVLTKARPGGGAVMVSQSYAEVDRIDREFPWRTAWIAGLALAAAALVSWLAIGRILRPIKRLVRATRHITTTQDLSMLLPEAGRGEVGELTGSFNSMLAALRFSRAQQQRLIEDASHELRTPLTSVRGSAELLQRARGKLPPADEAQVLTTLVQEATALDALVAELVDLAAGRHTAETPIEVDLPELAEDCAQRFRRRTGRTITITADNARPVSAGPQALARCVDNLLDNATKYSSAGAPVEVHVHGSRLTVRDHGPGIALEDRTSVFDRFFRADRTRATPGSGLGLAIVHDIVTAHGGRVFASNHPGGGAEVGFELPSKSET